MSGLREPDRRRGEAVFYITETIQYRVIARSMDHAEDVLVQAFEQESELTGAFDAEMVCVDDREVSMADDAQMQSTYAVFPASPVYGLRGSLVVYVSARGDEEAAARVYQAVRHREGWPQSWDAMRLDDFNDYMQRVKREPGPPAGLDLDIPEQA